MLFVSTREMPSPQRPITRPNALQMRLTETQKANLALIAKIRNVTVTEIIESCIDALPQIEQAKSV